MQGPTDPIILTKKIAFLRQVSLLAGLSDEDLARMSRDLQLRDYGKDQVIFRQGDASSELFIILRGRIRIFSVTPSGHETSIVLFSTGDVIGEFAAIDLLPRSATAKTLTPCTLAAIRGDRFLEYLRTIPDLSIGMLRLLAAKARWTTTYAEALAQYDAAGRLLHILLLYNERFGEEQEPGKRYVLDLGLNQSDLASIVGARRERINRILQNWHKRGLIEYLGGRIEILDLPRALQERDLHMEASLAKVDWDSPE